MFSGGKVIVFFWQVSCNIWQKNMAQILGIFLGQNPFSAIFRLKEMATKFEGGGKALIAGPLKKYRYYGFPYIVVDANRFRKNIKIWTKALLQSEAM